ncbi:MAG: hypothetical protein DRJ42_18930 [Deltaproteobacteria bacterium]|nr:MAG: hypothetical protein DRJ42_18930 [Deltaproteobacteria bacterium]
MRLALVSIALLLTSACDGDGDPGPTDSGVPTDAPPGTDTGTGVVAGDVPCEVADILADRCNGCHADTPRYGAPMPLTSHAALHAATVSDLSTSVYEMMGRRIHDTSQPMPPTTSTPLSPDEVAALDAYVAAMGPARPAGDSCEAAPDAGVMPPPQVGPEHLPCTPTHTFLAHGPSTDAPFEVPATASNLYQCFTFRSPFAAGAQATAFAPVIDDERVVHHWILYRTETPQTDGAVGPCNMPNDAAFVMGWAPGGTNTVMPADVGLELGGPDDYYLLQIHYWNVAGLTDSTDASGVAICAADTPRENEAGVLWLGSPRIDIPARATDHVVENVCPPLLTNQLLGPLTVMSSFPHMHQLGTKFITEIHPSGDASRAETLVEIERWDFNNQTSYPHVGRTLNPGDAIATRCTYDNPSDTTVSFGERTEDEMCFNFLTVYPLSNFPSAERRACLIF